jgi:uncharacterized membrane protein
VVGLGSSPNGLEAFLWLVLTDEIIPLGDLPGGDYDSVAHAISSDGRYIVGQSSSEFGTEAFIWSFETGMIGLGDLPDGMFGSQALSICGNGMAVVGVGTSLEGDEAFIWEPETGMLPLKLVLEDDDQMPKGFTLLGAGGLCDQGRRIVGWGLNRLGQLDMWYADIPARNFSTPQTFINCGLIDRFDAECVDGIATVRVESTLPAGTQLTIELWNGDLEGPQMRIMQLNANGNGRVRFTGLEGQYDVSILECQKTATMLVMCEIG